MAKYRALAASAKFWRPGEDYLREIGGSVKERVQDGDYVVVSEKAVSTALSRMVDESKVKPSPMARLIAGCWMRFAWGQILGRVCQFGTRLLRNLQRYPAEAGGRHKQVALEHAGLLQALMFGSEGGIDGSNLAYSYVSLPLKNAHKIAETVRERLWLTLGKRVCVMIVDTDKTYSFRNFHFTPRPKPMRGIQSFGGVVAYVVGRAFRFRRRSTPLAVAGYRLSAEEALEIAELANRARGFGSGRTVWDMAGRFRVDLEGVTWEMLEAVKHKPVVIVRRKR